METLNCKRVRGSRTGGISEGYCWKRKRRRKEERYGGSGVAENSAQAITRMPMAKVFFCVWPKHALVPHPNPVAGSRREPISQSWRGGKEGLYKISAAKRSTRIWIPATNRSIPWPDQNVLPDRSTLLRPGGGQRRLLGARGRDWRIHFNYGGVNVNLGQHTSQQWKPGANRDSIQDNIHAVFEQQQVGHSRKQSGNLCSRRAAGVRLGRGRPSGWRGSFGSAARRRLLAGSSCFSYGLQQPHRRLLLLVTTGFRPCFPGCCTPPPRPCLTRTICARVPRVIYYIKYSIH